MTVKCAQCGEELLGAVNRCWRCGTTFELHADKEGRPPIRRAPLAQPIPAAQRPFPEPALTPATTTESPEATPPSVRRGSPFSTPNASSTTPAAPARPATYRPTAIVPGPTAPVTLLSALLAVAVGVLGLSLVSSLPFAAVLIGVCGIGLAIVGLYGPRRWIAIVAVLLCFATIGWGGYRSAIEVYIYLNGVDPWHSDDLERSDDTMEENGNAAE